MCNMIKFTVQFRTQLCSSLKSVSQTYLTHTSPTFPQLLQLQSWVADYTMTQSFKGIQLTTIFQQINVLMVAHVQQLKYLLIYDMCKHVNESKLLQLGTLKCLTLK